MKHSLTLVAKSKYYSWLMILIAAFLYAVGINAFISVARIFPMGLMSFANLIVYITPTDISPFLSFIYFGLNIPLVIFFWKKIKRRYIYKSLFFLVAQALFGLIFLVPEIRDLIWKNFLPDSTSADLFRAQRWPTLVISAVGAMIAAIGMGLSWKHGGSTGGTDLIIYYYSYKYKKPIGKISTIISLTIVTFSFIVSLVLNRPNDTRELWFIVLLGSMIYLFISVTIVDLIYPKYSKVRLDIYSVHPERVSEYLKNSKFNHPWSISTLHSGYTGQEKKVISTTILLLELRDLIKVLYKIDDKLWISVVKVKMNYGNFNFEGVEK